MLLAVNLMMCLFVLCIFSVLDKPLRDLSLRPAIGSLICAVTAGLMLLEDVRLTNALYANLGGFFVPVIGVVALCFGLRSGSRKYILLMSLFIGVGTWIFNQITYRALEATQEYAAIFQGLFCLLFANILDNEVKPVLIMSILGFHLCDIMGYIVTIASGQSAFLILGDGIKAVMMVALAVCSVTLCRLRSGISQLWHKHTGGKPAGEAQPESS